LPAGGIPERDVVLEVNMTERMDRIEATLERSTQLLEKMINVQESQQAMISRLDSILERLVYREGREDSP
jgi:hypothetical protein